MFVRVQEENLVIGTKYKITLPQHPQHFPTKEICMLEEFHIHTAVFKKSIPHLYHTSLKFEHAYYYYNQYEHNGSNISIVSHTHRYYAFISDQPQWKMERRAVNLIVRRLIGDDCFEW
jgi:hypothetical protein